MVWAVEQLGALLPEAGSIILLHGCGRSLLGDSKLTK